MFKKKLIIVFVLFSAVNLYSQIDTGLAHKSFAYVSAQKGGNIQIIDNISKTFIGSIGIISTSSNWRNSQRTLGISKDGQFLFQDSYGLATTTQIIDVATNTIVSGINFSDKSGMVSSPDGNTIYTGRAYSINKYDILNNTVTSLASRNTGTCNTTNPNEAYSSVRLAISSNGNSLYVANLDPRKKGISVYNTSDGSEVKINSGISGATKLNISPDDAYVYVCNTSWGYSGCSGDPSLMTDIYGNNVSHSSDVAIIETSTNTVVDYLNTGSATDVVVNKDGSKIFIGSGAGVTVIERNLSSNVHTIGSDLYATGAVTHMEIDPSGDFLYVVSADVLKLVKLSDGTITTLTTTSESNKSLGNIVFSSYYTAPIGLSVSTDPANNNSILNWTSVDSPTLVNYKIYGGTTPSNLQLIGTVNSGIETFTHSNLLGETTYYYKISAEDDQNNESNKSLEVSTTTAVLPAIISGPNGITGNTSSISISENKTDVFGFSANVPVTWSLGTSNDEDLFSLDTSGNLVFNLAPDFETPLSSINSNTYLVDIIAADASSRISNQMVTITIMDVDPAAMDEFNSVTKTYFDRSYIIIPPTSSNTKPVTFSSSDPSVATISGTTVTIIGIGTTTLTASQEFDSNYDSNSITSTLTINNISVLTKNGDISETALNYVNKNGKIGSGSAINKNGASNYTKNLVVIGDNYNGGIVGYILQPGDQGYDSDIQHGLIIATTDQSSGANNGTYGQEIQYVTPVDIGSGQINTALVAVNVTNGGVFICANLDLNGYRDWFLPSRDELLRIYENRAIIGGFNTSGNERYWTSSFDPTNANKVYSVNFTTGIADLVYKSNNTDPSVRAIRYF